MFSRIAHEWALNVAGRLWQGRFGAQVGQSSGRNSANQSG